jgi:TetR/AcrR family transcriptional repressor of nem operon
MARPREFDPDEALEGAMQLFWSRGLTGTSMDELCTATGLSRSSIYACFGDKRELFLRCVDRYAERGTDRFEALRSGSVPVRVAMAELLFDLIDRIVSGTGNRGCLLGNSAAELAPTDAVAMGRVRAGLERVEAVVRDGLERARDAGEIAAGTDVDELAKFFVVGMQGMRLVGKARPDRDALNAVAETMLRVLDR